MGHTVGVSRSLMRMIERRQFFDKLVIYGGMLVTAVIVYMLLVELHNRKIFGFVNVPI